MPGCLLTRPPPLRAVDFTADGGCPEPWVGCLSVQTAADLAYDLEVLEDWETEAWSLCGPADGGISAAQLIAN